MPWLMEPRSFYPLNDGVERYQIPPYEGAIMTTDQPKPFLAMRFLGALFMLAVATMLGWTVYALTCVDWVPTHPPVSLWKK